MTTTQQKKLTFSHILNTHRITMITLAKEVGLPRTVLYAMLMGRPVFVDQAHAVLTGLSRLTGTTYTLQNVSITLESLGNTAAVWQYPTQLLRAVSISQSGRKSTPLQHHLMGSSIETKTKKVKWKCTGEGVQWRVSY